ncbi:MAG: ATP-binding cassette domain-containing protein, partial [bacterium]
SGKSTLLLTLAGLIQPDKGSVIIGRENIVEKSQSRKTDWRRKNIGMVFQGFYLLPYFTVLENVLFAAQKKGCVIQRKAVEILESMGLSERILHRPDELSMGQCQKTAIARAIINAPRLLLIDEPTGNLDPQSAEDVMGIFKDLHEKQTTLILVTHNPSIADYADSHYNLENGVLKRE